MQESAQQPRRRGGDHRVLVLTSIILVLAAAAVIAVAAWPGGKAAGGPGNPVAMASNATATPAATAAAQQPTQAAAEEANLGGAIKPANSLRLAVWDAGKGGAALKVVSADLGTVLMMHAGKQIPQMPHACRALGVAASAALAAAPIPDASMRLWYKRALAEIGAGATDCRAALSSMLHGDEDLVVNVNTALMDRAMSELTTGSRQLYKATAYVKAARP